MSLRESGEGMVTVEYGQFFVMPGSSEVLPPTESGDDDYLEATAGGIRCISSAPDHDALVHLEAWTSEPPSQTSDWEVARDVSLVRGAGPAYAVALMGGPETVRVDLPVPAGEAVMARVLCRGRGRVKELFIADPATPPPAGTEEWLVQFWPTGPAA